MAKYRVSLVGPLSEVYSHVGDVEKSLNHGMRVFGFEEKIEVHGEIPIGILEFATEPEPAVKAKILAEVAEQVARKYPRMKLAIEPA